MTHTTALPHVFACDASLHTSLILTLFFSREQLAYLPRFASNMSCHLLNDSLTLLSAGWLTRLSAFLADSLALTPFGPLARRSSDSLLNTTLVE